MNKLETTKDDGERHCCKPDSHEELLAALEAMTPEIPLDYTLTPPVCRFCGAEHPNPDCVWTRARDAIKRARGEE